MLQEKPVKIHGNKKAHSKISKINTAFLLIIS